MKAKILVILSIMILMVSSYAFSAGNWWEADQAATASSTTVIARGAGPAPGQTSASMVNWEDGYIEAVGMATVDTSRMVNRVQAELMAKEGARAMAYARLAEVVNGVAVSSETLVEQCLTTDQIARTQTQALIKGARILEETVTWEGNAPKGMCRLGLVLKGERGVQAPMVEWMLRTRSERNIPLFKPANPTVAGFSASNTGIVIDARGMGLVPAMAPQILTDNGQLLYGATIIDRNAALQYGVAGYSSNLSSSIVTQRVGANPLIIKAESLYGGQNAGVKISTGDALKALLLNSTKGLLKLGKVLFLM